ncbi:MAG: hypothetical protein HWQ38_33860 [Nostoc sp. NMS7]|nr:hypothetical protein [Nostoc sp. NMS7]
MRAKPNRVVVSTEEQALIEFRKRITSGVNTLTRPDPVTPNQSPIPL